MVPNAMAMFESTIAQPLFPTILWVHDLSDADAATMNAHLSSEIEKLRDGRLRDGGASVWQTEQTLHQRPEFAGFTAMVNTALTGVLGAMEIQHDGYEITGCWANVSVPNAVHGNHTHPNNYLSGVYYVQTPPPSDSIRFHDPRSQPKVISPEVRQNNEFNASKADVPVKPGRLIIFPAWLEHSVMPNASKGTRISISFNAMFERFSERMARPKWQGAEIC